MTRKGCYGSEIPSLPFAVRQHDANREGGGRLASAIQQLRTEPTRGLAITVEDNKNRALATYPPSSQLNCLFKFARPNKAAARFSDWLRYVRKAGGIRICENAPNHNR